MKKILSFGLITIYLMIPGNAFAQGCDDSQQIEEIVTIMVESTS